MPRRYPEIQDALIEYADALLDKDFIQVQAAFKTNMNILKKMLTECLDVRDIVRMIRNQRSTPRPGATDEQLDQVEEEIRSLFTQAMSKVIEDECHRVACGAFLGIGEDRSRSPVAVRNPSRSRDRSP